MRLLREIVDLNLSGTPVALPSVCSAHPDVLAACLRLAEREDQPLLIEATSNQVNQFGGYTGMQPADFRDFVRRICVDHQVDPDRVHFGGDHLGPQAWRSEDAQSAMARARDLVAAYVRAGFTKIHLDCSEGCAGEGPQVGDETSARRAAELAVVCEAAAPSPEALSYVVGTEVPPPGGAKANGDHDDILPTSTQSARETIRIHREAFREAGLSETAWPRVAALVVQPGLEFGPQNIHHFDPARPDELSAALADAPGVSFEAHSTDYQRPEVYSSLARRHFAVLKVGPALTFAYRQAIYALDAIGGWLLAEARPASVPATLDRLMLENPVHWRKHYAAEGEALRVLRHFSYADRIRYYWTEPHARNAVADLLAALAGHTCPRPLLEQYFSNVAIERADAIGLDWCRSLIFAEVELALEPYMACMSGAPSR